MSKFQELIDGDKPVLVDFFAEWCGPCKTMKPVLDQVKTQVGDGAMIIKVDIDKNPSAAARFNIQGVPTFLLFKRGEIVWRKSGAIQGTELLSAIRSAGG